MTDEEDIMDLYETILLHQVYVVVGVVVDQAWLLARLMLLLAGLFLPRESKFPLALNCIKI